MLCINPNNDVIRFGIIHKNVIEMNTHASVRHLVAKYKQPACSANQFPMSNLDLACGSSNSPIEPPHISRICDQVVLEIGIPDSNSLLVSSHVPLIGCVRKFPLYCCINELYVGWHFKLFHP